jgi:DNA topoisomerase-3
MRVYIAEKPSVGKAIAENLGPQKRGEGMISCGDDVVTWCFGHLLEQAEPDAYNPEYKRWSLDHLPIIPAEWKLEVKSDAKEQVAVIRGLLKSAKEVVHCGDADREGQLLVDEVLEFCGYRGPVKRLWLSAMDDASVRKALSALKDNSNYHGLYQSALARARADWIVGMNMTRAYTIAGRNSGHDGVLSVGRVQTPTLAIVVRRDLDIENFKVRDFFVPTANFQHQAGDFKTTWVAPEVMAGCDEEGRLVDRAIADSIVAKINGQRGTIAKYEQKAGKETPPLPFSLSELQKACSAKWGMGAQSVLDVAQALYETHKVATYPRSDCGYLPESQHADATKILAMLKGVYSFANGAHSSIKSAAFNDKKISAHHGIIPTGIKPNGLSDAEARVFELICKHYVAQFYPDHEYLSTSVEVSCAGETFKATGRVPTKPGWRVIFERVTDNEDSEETTQLPQMKIGDSAQCIAAQAEAKQTKPPARFTDGTLIAAMTNVHKFVQDPEIKQRLRETQGIGTEATRASVIETLLKRRFIEKKGKQLISTTNGRALIAALGESEVANPGMTALFEQSLEMILEGKLDINSFLGTQRDWINKQIEASKSKSGVAVTAANPCPDCKNGHLWQRKGPKGVFWGCSGYPACSYTAPDVKGKPDIKNGRTKAKAS